METMLATTMRSTGKIGSTGASNTTITTKVLNITPEMADDLLKLNTRNRPVSKKTVDDYATQMQKGLWQLNGEPIIISNTNIILDGQHRLHALIKAGISQKMLLVTGVASDAFRTIDTGLTRTGGSIFSIAGINNATSISAIIASEFALLANNTIGYIGGGACLRTIKRSKQELLNEYYKTPELYQEIKNKATKCYEAIRIMTKSETGAYMAYLIRQKNHDTERVFSFFDQLFFDRNIENATIPTLRKRLIQSALGQYKMSAKLKRALVIKTWNCYVTGRELERLLFNTEKDIMPEFI